MFAQFLLSFPDATHKRNYCKRMIGADPNVKTDYTSCARSSFLNPCAPKPQRVRKNANESMAFEKSDAPMIAQLPKNQVPANIAEARRNVSIETLSTRAARAQQVTHSQVDCSVMGAPFTGVSETSATLSQTWNNETKVKGPTSFVSAFRSPVNPVTLQSVPYTPAPFDHPLGGHMKRVSLDRTRRAEMVQDFVASVNPSGERKSLQGIF